jgi:hypothetical protein
MEGIELLIFMAGFFLGGLAYRQFILMVSNQILNAMIQEALEQSQRPTEVACVVEQHQGQYFLYQHPEMKFIAQAATLEEINKIVQDKYPTPVLLKLNTANNENSHSQ